MCHKNSNLCVAHRTWVLQIKVISFKGFFCLMTADWFVEKDQTLTHYLRAVNTSGYNIQHAQNYFSARKIVSIRVPFRVLTIRCRKLNVVHLFILESSSIDLSKFWGMGGVGWVDTFELSLVKKNATLHCILTFYGDTESTSSDYLSLLTLLNYVTRYYQAVFTHFYPW